MKKLLLLTLVFSLNMFMIGNARAGTTYLNDCAYLVNPMETYVLTTDINTTDTNCFFVWGPNDIILDCQNHYINFGDWWGGTLTYGIRILDSNNVTIKNCILTNWRLGILASANYTTIINNTLDRNVNYGVTLGGFNNIAMNNTVNSSDTGILISGESNNVTKNTFNRNGFSIFLRGKNHFVLNNLIYNSIEVGVRIVNANNSMISDNLFDSNGNGIIEEGSNNIITNNEIINSVWNGISLGGSNDIMTNNIIANSTYHGIHVYNSNYNLIYNNLLNNTVNWWLSSLIPLCYWNTTKTLGTNIIGGPYIGGNYWTNLNGNGYSDNCVDVNYDGFCDESYQLNENNIDYLPITHYIAGSTTTSTTTTSTTTIPILRVTSIEFWYGGPLNTTYYTHDIPISVSVWAYYGGLVGTHPSQYIKYSLDNRPNVTLCENCQQFYGVNMTIPNGVHTLTYYGLCIDTQQDSCGGITEFSASITFKVLAGPRIIDVQFDNVSPDNTTYYTNNIPVFASVWERIEGVGYGWGHSYYIKYSLDNQPNVTLCENCQQFYGLDITVPNGVHTFAFYGYTSNWRNLPCDITEFGYSFIFTVKLDSDNDGVFDTEDKCPNTVGQQLVYGCSCQQILDLKPGVDAGEYRNGCSQGTIEVFTKAIGWAKDLFG